MKNPAKMQARATLAHTIIEKMKLRGFEGMYAENSEDALQMVKEMLKPGDSVAWGGSATLDETGIMPYLLSSDCDIINRGLAKTKEDEKEIKARTINADYFFLSANAITQDGMLVNIDGAGNRLAYLVYGPENVVVVAGMNKIVVDLEEAFKRVRNVASPPNTIRLEKDTPCARTGQCGNCLGEDCICCSAVVTRKSRQPGRIKVILVGEDLGF